MSRSRGIPPQHASPAPATWAAAQPRRRRETTAGHAGLRISVADVATMEAAARPLTAMPWGARRRCAGRASTATGSLPAESARASRIGKARHALHEIRPHRSLRLGALLRLDDLRRQDRHLGEDRQHRAAGGRSPRRRGARRRHQFLRHRGRRTPTATPSASWGARWGRGARTSCSRARCAAAWDPDPTRWGSRARTSWRRSKASLRRLGTDWLDLYQIHGYDALTPLDETLRALDDLVRAGKVRYVGCSNLAAWQIAKANGLAAAHDWSRFESLQAYYTIAARDIERETRPAARRPADGADGVEPAGRRPPLRQVQPRAGRPRRARAARSSTFRWSIASARSTASTRCARSRAAHGVSVARVALAWLLAQPHVTTIIIGAKTEAQLARQPRRDDAHARPPTSWRRSTASARCRSSTRAG